MDVHNILKKAQEERYAIGQFNTCNLEILRAILQAVQNLKSPVIIGTSEGESKFMGLEQIAGLVEVWRKETGLPIILNLDHGHSLEYLKKAIDAGYSAVHFDGSTLPFEENIARTKEVVDYARKKGILVEGELGYLRGASELHKIKIEITEEDLTRPDQAEKFIKETGVDSLAVVIGNIHGIESGGKNPHLFLDRLARIKEKTGDKFLVLHGGSGIPKEDILESIKLGIVKINVNTELRLAHTNALKRVLAEKPEETTPYKYMPEVIEAVQKVVEEKIRLFGSQAKLG